MSAVRIALLLFAATTQVTGPGVDDAATVRFVDGVVAETTARWTQALNARGITYTPPRVLYLRFPAGHPGRGAGLSSHVGLVIDLADLQGLDRVLGADSHAMTALIVAHEVGHRVQNVRAAADDAPLPPVGAPRETQADCYAGWWLGRSEFKDVLDEGKPAERTFTLKLSRTLQVLDLLEHGGVVLRRDSEDAPGRLSSRVTAIRRGAALSDPWSC